MVFFPGLCNCAVQLLLSGPCFVILKRAGHSQERVAAGGVVGCSPGTDLSFGKFLRDRLGRDGPAPRGPAAGTQTRDASIPARHQVIAGKRVARLSTWVRVRHALVCRVVLLDF